MEVERTTLWILMGAFSAVGVAWAIHRQVRNRPGTGRLARLGQYAEALLMGVGLGLSAATVMLMIAALIHGLETLQGPL